MAISTIASGAAAPAAPRGRAGATGRARRAAARKSRGPRVAAVLACAALLGGCSGDGDGPLGFGGGDDGDSPELVATEFGRGVVDGATTTILAPPEWEGDVGLGDDGGGGRDGRVDGDSTGGSRDNRGGGFGFGGRDLSAVTDDAVSEFCASPSRCDIDSRDIDHPSWGPTRVFTVYPDTDADNGSGHIAAVDASGDVKWSYTGPYSATGAWGFATDGPDAAGALFVSYNPGRWNGVIALHPVRDGFRSLPDGGGDGDYMGDGDIMFYNAEVGEPDEDGNREIITFEHDTSGGRSMANATIYRHFLTWTGDGYEELRPRQRIN